jgi:hypothetical protein
MAQCHGHFNVTFESVSTVTVTVTGIAWPLRGKGLLWYARPQLFFHCTVAPTGSLSDTGRHRQLALVFFSTFKPNSLPIDSTMKREGLPMFYDSAGSTNLPSLYLCRAENVLGHVPMMQGFVAGNSLLTLPH